jgi:hypothetical protein
LLRTPTTELLKESSIESLEEHLKRMNAFYVFRVLITPELALVRDLILSSEGDSVAAQLFRMWNTLFMPYSFDADEVREASCRLRHVLFPKQQRDSRKYFGDSWKEKLMSRIRMGVLPTQAWAKSMRLSTSDRCRHCGFESETLPHLFGNCSAVSYEDLNHELERVVQVAVSWDSIRDLALKTEEESYPDFCRAVFRFVKSSKLFRKSLPQANAADSPCLSASNDVLESVLSNSGGFRNDLIHSSHSLQESQHSGEQRARRAAECGEGVLCSREHLQAGQKLRSSRKRARTSQEKGCVPTSSGRRCGGRAHRDCA